MKNLLILMTVCYLFSSCSSEKIVSTERNNDMGKLIEQGNRKVVNSSSNELSIVKSNSSVDNVLENKIVNFVSSSNETNSKVVSQSQEKKSTLNKILVGNNVKVSAPQKITIKQTNNASKNIVKKENAKKPAPSSGGKSWIVALLLCIFLGGLGIHRFYLGYTGIGIFELLTGGGFGILWLIDLVRIIVGNLKPKDGDYK